jgi:hypothetical protein
MNRREFIQSNICLAVGVCLRNSLHASIYKPFKDTINSTNNVAPREQVFPVKLISEFSRLYESYVHWLKTLIERLGYKNTINVWQDAYQNYDEKMLNKILSSGWTKKNDYKLSNQDEKINDIIETYFSVPVGGLTKNEAKQLIEITPPIMQIKKNCATLHVWKDITAYDYIHLSLNGVALLVESLIKHFKKEGELIAYDFIRAKRTKGSENDNLSVKELISAIGSITKSDKPNLMTAALKVDIISSSEKEIIMHVKACEWARYFRENYPKVGYLINCSTDEAAYRTANKNIRMQRTSTLMEGGKVCDFRVYAIS